LIQWSAVRIAIEEMMTTPPMDSCLTSANAFAQPLYFKSGKNDLFGWLHRPNRPFEPKLGVVICGPFGYESICAHRGVREFAEGIVAAGIPALRFDYLGTGDSADSNENDDHVKLWTRDVIAAIHELRSRTGVERICLLGIRLGALLATLAATECGIVEALILIGPVVSGKRYVRELRTAQLAGIALAGTAPIDSGPEASRDNSGALEAGGFSLSAATLQSLVAADLLTAVSPPVSSMLILDNDKLPSAHRWAESLAHSGIELEYRSLPGLIEMAMTAPQFAVVPRSMIETTRHWLATVAAPLKDGKTTEISQVSTTPLESFITILPFVAESTSAQASIAERPVFISAGATLFGIVSEPRVDETRRRGVILLNPGADSHIGASRMYVSLARRWARRGYFVLRLDLAGIGDSATRPGLADDEVFPEEATNDISSAIEFMRSRYAIVDMTLAGLCSGAYHALRAAVAGASINRILMVNPQNYFWKKGMTLDQVQLVEVVHNPGLYRRSVFSPRAWLKMFSGQVNVTRIAIIYFHRLRLAADTTVRSLSRRLGIRLPNDLGWELEKIAGTGIRATFLFARGEPGIELLKLQAGSKVTQLGDRCRIRIVESGDHIFSRREHRSIMEDVLSEELFLRADDGISPTASPTSDSAMHASVK
jgi:pimeloyl-ACP methyl ester carboxylesterase